MQLDKNALNQILMGSDEQLWQTIRMIAAASGATIPEKISPMEIAALRKALSKADDKDIEKALKTLENYRSK